MYLGLIVMFLTNCKFWEHWNRIAERRIGIGVLAVPKTVPKLFRKRMGTLNSLKSCSHLRLYHRSEQSSEQSREHKYTVSRRAESSPSSRRASSRASS